MGPNMRQYLIECVIVAPEDGRKTKPDMDKANNIFQSITKLDIYIWAS